MRSSSPDKKTVVVALGFNQSDVEALNSVINSEVLECRCHTITLMSRRGRRNFVRLLYGHESWWDERRANYFARRTGNRDVTIFECLVSPGLNLQAWKESLRQRFCLLENPSGSGHIHLPDSDLEVKWVVRFLAHEDSPLWLENGPDLVPRSLKDALREWAIELRNYPAPETLVLTMGAVLRLHGLISRQFSDVDFVSRGTLLRKIPNITFDLHTEKEWLLTKDELNFESFFSYKNFLMVNLKTLARQKYRRYLYRGVAKDLNDLTKIMRIQNSGESVAMINKLTRKLGRIINEVFFAVTMTFRTRRRRFHLDP